METLEQKKAENIVLMDVSEVASFTDYFIICSGSSDRMLKSLGDAVMEDAHKNFKLNGRFEGKSENGWVLIDLNDIIVHIFFEDQRKYYSLEDLWEHGKILVTIQ
ncbi:MAG: ribosome silencing factor [Anaerolineaceae bacterium]